MLYFSCTKLYYIYIIIKTFLRYMILKHGQDSSSNYPSSMQLNTKLFHALSIRYYTQFIK